MAMSLGSSVRSRSFVFFFQKCFATKGKSKEWSGKAGPLQPHPVEKTNMIHHCSFHLTAPGLFFCQSCLATRPSGNSDQFQALKLSLAPTFFLSVTSVTKHFSVLAQAALWNQPYTCGLTTPWRSKICFFRGRTLAAKETAIWKGGNQPRQTSANKQQNLISILSCFLLQTQQAPTGSNLQPDYLLKVLRVHEQRSHPTNSFCSRSSTDLGYTNHQTTIRQNQHELLKNQSTSQQQIYLIPPTQTLQVPPLSSRNSLHRGTEAKTKPLPTSPWRSTAEQMASKCLGPKTSPQRSEARRRPFLGSLSSGFHLVFTWFSTGFHRKSRAFGRLKSTCDLF